MIEKLRSFVLWLVDESLRSQYCDEMRGGHACSGLIGDMALLGAEAWSNRVCRGTGTEYRLNKAGLKLYIDINTGLKRIRVRIGGDQEGYYPTFVEAAKAELQRRGLSESHQIVWRNII
jgi:hypothetical protein